MSDPFTRFCIAANKAKAVNPFFGTLMALDPGETTGMAIFKSGPNRIDLIHFAQLDTWPMNFAVASFMSVLETHKPSYVVHEVYRVYGWKTDEHSWSEVPTLRIIGCLETLCIQRSLRYHSQTAQQAKNFCTDDKLKSWGMFEGIPRHARDAIRHGTYNLLFGPHPS